MKKVFYEIYYFPSGESVFCSKKPTKKEIEKIADKQGWYEYDIHFVIDIIKRRFII